MSFGNKRLFIITGADGSGKTKVISDLQKIKSFYLVNYISTSPQKELGMSQVSWDVFQSFAEKDGFVISYKKRNAMIGVTYEEIKKAEQTELPIVWEIDIQWIENIKNEYPEARTILVNGLGAEGFFQHYESKGNAVPNLTAIKAQRAEQLHSWWRGEVDFTVENKAGESAKAAEEIKKIMEG